MGGWGCSEFTKSFVCIVPDIYIATPYMLTKTQLGSSNRSTHLLGDVMIHLDAQIGPLLVPLQPALYPITHTHPHTNTNK